MDENAPEFTEIDNQDVGFTRKPRKHKRKREEVEKTVAVTADDAKKERKRKRKEMKESAVTEEGKKKKNKTKDKSPVPVEATAEIELETFNDPSQKLVSSDKPRKPRHRKLRRLARENAVTNPNEEGTSAIDTIPVSSEKEEKQGDPTSDDEAKPSGKDKSEKKRSQEIAEIENSNNEVVDNLDASSQLEKKSKRKQKQATVEVAEPSNPPKLEKPSRRKRKDAVVEAAEPNIDNGAAPADGEEERTHKKKRKHKELDGSHVDVSEPVEPPASHTKKKRSSRKQVDFPNASEDSTLSESAQKALLYVHAKVSGQPDWKFNKARQNWVLRNMWDESAIPETYFASCVQYLAGVQGNTRDLLIKSSTTLLNPEPAASETDPKESSTDDAVKSENPVPKPATDGDEVTSVEEQVRRQQVKIERARAVLGALGADEVAGK